MKLRWSSAVVKELRVVPPADAGREEGRAARVPAEAIFELWPLSRRQRHLKFDLTRGACRAPQNPASPKQSSVLGSE